MNLFYKATPLYKEYQILNLISSNDTITQRMISENLGVAVSMVNKYLKEYEESGYIKIKYISDKRVEYNLTQRGEDRIRFLNIGFLSSSSQVYEAARRNVLDTLENVLSPNAHRIIMYGAGEVAEIIIDVLNSEIESNLKVLAIIDDDVSKQGNTLGNTRIIPLTSLGNYKYDELLISTYRLQDQIYDKLLAVVDSSVIKKYFPSIL